LGRFARGASVFALSSAFAVAGTAALAAVANAQGWCCVHSWALAHGTGVAVLLLFGLLGFHAVRGAGLRAGLLPAATEFGWLSHIAYVGGALGTFIFTEHFMWLGLGAGVAAVVLHRRGRKVHPFGLAVVGLVVSALSVAYWAYIEWVFLSVRANGG
jgi:hypothetical protein